MPPDDQPAQPPALSAHDAAMVAKVDAAHAKTVQDASPTPIGGTPPVTPPADPPVPPADTPPAGAAPADGTKPPEAPPADAPKVDLAPFSAEFASNGKLSDESYTKLAAAGYDKTIVDGYIAGQQALQQQAVADVLAPVGGSEGWAKMSAWANANMTAAEHEAFNQATAGGAEQAKLALVGLKAKYDAANGSAPALLKGTGTVSEGEQPFASKAEMTTAMRDPRYRSDPAYRGMVERRTGLMTSF